MIAHPEKIYNRTSNFPANKLFENFSEICKIRLPFILFLDIEKTPADSQNG
jgi:hypothetical protein